MYRHQQQPGITADNSNAGHQLQSAQLAPDNHNGRSPIPTVHVTPAIGQSLDPKFFIAKAEPSVAPAGTSVQLSVSNKHAEHRPVSVTWSFDGKVICKYSEGREINPFEIKNVQVGNSGTYEWTVITTNSSTSSGQVHLSVVRTGGETQSNSGEQRSGRHGNRDGDDEHDDDQQGAAGGRASGNQEDVCLTTDNGNRIPQMTSQDPRKTQGQSSTETAMNITPDSLLKGIPEALQKMPTVETHFLYKSHVESMCMQQKLTASQGRHKMRANQLSGLGKTDEQCLAEFSKLNISPDQHYCDQNVCPVGEEQSIENNELVPSACPDLLTTADPKLECAKCTKRIGDMMDNQDLMCQLKFVMSPEGDKLRMFGGRLGIKDEKLTYMLKVSPEQAVRGIFQHLKSSRPNLRVAHLLEALYRPSVDFTWCDVIEKIHKWHTICPACQLVYQKFF